MSLLQLMQEKAKDLAEAEAEEAQHKSDLPPKHLSRDFVKTTTHVRDVEAVTKLNAELLFEHEKAEVFLGEDNEVVPYHMQGDEEIGAMAERDRAKRHPKVTRWIEALWGLFDTVRVAITTEGASIQQEQYFGAYLRMYKALVPPTHFELNEARAAVGRDWRRDMNSPLVDRDYRTPKRKKRLKEFFVDESSQAARARNAKEWQERQDEIMADAAVWRSIGEELGEGGHPDSPARTEAPAQVVHTPKLGRRSSWRSALRSSTVAVVAPSPARGTQGGGSEGAAVAGEGGAAGVDAAAAAKVSVQGVAARQASVENATLVVDVSNAGAGCDAPTGAPTAASPAKAAVTPGRRKASALWKLAARVAASDADRRKGNTVAMGKDGLPVVTKPAAAMLFDRAQFFESMRELADVWSLGTEPSEYARFLKRLYFRVTERAKKTGRRRWAGIKAILGGGFGHPGDKGGGSVDSTAEAEAAELDAESDASSESSYYSTAEGGCGSESDGGTSGGEGTLRGVGKRRARGARQRIKRGRKEAAAADDVGGGAHTPRGREGASGKYVERSGTQIGMHGHVELVSTGGRRLGSTPDDDGDDSSGNDGDDGADCSRDRRAGASSEGGGRGTTGGEGGEATEDGREGGLVCGADSKGDAVAGSEKTMAAPSSALVPKSSAVNRGRRASMSAVDDSAGPWWFNRFVEERGGGDTAADLTGRSGALARPVRQRGPLVPVHDGPTQALTVTRRSSVSVANTPLPAHAARRLSTTILAKTTTDVAQLSLAASAASKLAALATPMGTARSRMASLGSLGVHGVEHVGHSALVATTSSPAMSMSMVEPNRPVAAGSPVTRRSVKLTKTPNKKGCAQ